VVAKTHVLRAQRGGQPVEALYIGVDLHSAFFQACAVVVSGERAWESRFPRTDEGLTAFRARCTPLAVVAVEASTPTWHFVDAIADCVGRVVVVDAFRTRLKAGYAAKTDRLDARRLADAVRRESVVGIYVPPPVVREWRELCRYRQTLVRTRTALIQRMRAVLLRQGIVESRRLVRPSALTTLDRFALPGRAGEAVAGLRALLLAVHGQLTGVDQAVREEAAGDPVVRALMTITGVGPVLGLTIRAEIGTIHRFSRAPEVASYAGLVPRIDASASRVYHGRITRRGSPWLRWALVEAAIHRMRQTDGRGRWARRLAVRKGALKARVAMARRLCEEVFVVWRQVG
jgi:transposase